MFLRILELSTIPARCRVSDRLSVVVYIILETIDDVLRRSQNATVKQPIANANPVHALDPGPRVIFHASNAVAKCQHDVDLVLFSLSSQLLPPFSLLPKRPPRHLQHIFESFLAPLRILPKSLYTRLLDLRPDLLPASTQRRNLRLLLELCSLVAWAGRLHIRLVHYRLATADDVGPGEIGGAHSDALGRRVDDRSFIDVGGVRTAQEGKHPGWGGLGTGNQALCTENTS